MARTPWARVARGLAGVALLAYPVLVWLGLSSRSPRAIALILLCVLAPAAFLRLRTVAGRELRGLAAIPLASLASLALASWLDSLGFILAVPVAINAILLLTFGATLRAGARPMIERFARLQESSLSAEQLAWCRLWTCIWCLFFVVNGGLAAGLACLAPLSWWALYNGLVAYALIGSLLATEWLLRRRRFPGLREAGDGPL